MGRHRLQAPDLARERRLDPDIIEPRQHAGPHVLRGRGPHQPRGHEGGAGRREPHAVARGASARTTARCTRPRSTRAAASSSTARTCSRRRASPSPRASRRLTAAAAELQAAHAGDPSFSGLYLPGISWQSALAWQFTEGGRLAEQDGDTWKGSLSSPESQKAFQALQEIWKTGSTAGTVTDSEVSEKPWVPFNAGETAMFFGFNWHLANIDQALVDAGNVGYFGFPAAAGGDAGHPFAGGSNVAISGRSKNQDLAKEVMKLIFSQPFQEYFASVGGWVPGNLDYAGALGSDESRDPHDGGRAQLGRHARGAELGARGGRARHRRLLRRDRGRRRPRRARVRRRRQAHEPARIGVIRP
ncbi:extracellular solute-binding protein [Clavibacter tessellarius]|uniref:extracellular solute-binding protein n=1 Tax=Clavibacter tessellarius TaxID=31965 RepID=UPI00324F9BDF